MSRPIRVDLITSEGACGIAEHSAYLMEAVRAVSPLTTFAATSAKYLDPAEYFRDADSGALPRSHVVHLNYHAALHSRWTSEQIGELHARGRRVLVTYHDSGVPNSLQCKLVCRAADRFVLHESFKDMPTDTGTYCRMGVPAAEDDAKFFFLAASLHRDGIWGRDQPILGTVGFDFPWKCYDELARITEAAGWGLLLLSPQMTEERQRALAALNPACVVVSEWTPRREVVSYLTGCSATACTMVCANAGQSASFLQCIAARRSVIALSTCRMMRALYEDPQGREAIWWCENFEEVAGALRNVTLGHADAGVVALAHQERWTVKAEVYDRLYQELL